MAVINFCKFVGSKKLLFDQISLNANRSKGVKKKTYKFRYYHAFVHQK